MVYAGDNEKAKLASDPMYRLENTVKDVAVAEAEAPRLDKLYQFQSRNEDSYSVNAALRKQMRERKRVERDEEERKLLPSTNALEAFGHAVTELNVVDQAALARVKFARRNEFVEDRSRKRIAISTQSVFASTAPTPKELRSEGSVVRKDSVVRALAAFKRS
eukprot:TRINITY_DN2547_c0_g1_i1.p1 TRINITY_DN2547_c0_g1~~TRINITY_DN2547_c0_g1_i1.p1  ORF type:complete len:162 (-),score=40.63 TRINITY_DN2547_c0_g1_i1:293-778(-)